MILTLNNGSVKVSNNFINENYDACNAYLRNPFFSNCSFQNVYLLNECVLINITVICNGLSCNKKNPKYANR